MKRIALVCSFVIATFTINAQVDTQAQRYAVISYDDYTGRGNVTYSNGEPMPIVREEGDTTTEKVDLRSALSRLEQMQLEGWKVVDLNTSVEHLGGTFDAGNYAPAKFFFFYTWYLSKATP